ncbi:MAG: hypothetical protein HYU63_05765, partial [Armatimonadetes bacterium]|nr:hypothetical protein [Armatimonadota bacterium]
MNILNLSPEELIAKAISKEQDAYNLYCAYSNIIEDRAASQILKELAEEELKHKKILEGIDISVFRGFSISKIKNQHLTDFM